MFDSGLQQDVGEELLALLRHRLIRRAGLSFPAERRQDLLRVMAAASREAGCSDTRAYLRWLLSRPNSEPLDHLIHRLTIGETYFFRDPAAFYALQSHIIPQLIRERRGRAQYLRLWSAGCSSGEEAYSLAVVLHRCTPDIAQWGASILATDINPHFLRKAAQGVYSNWSFREAPPGLALGNFRSAGTGCYEVAPHLRSLVRFAELNLALDDYPGGGVETRAMDVIFCRNVLMYLEPECARAVVERLSQSLAEGGWLFVSPVENSLVAGSELVPVRMPNTIGHRKLPRRQQRAQLVPMPLPPRRSARPPQTRTPPPSSDQHQELGGRAAQWYAQGRNDEVIALLEPVLQGEPGPPRLQVLLARACANSGRLHDARHWCLQALAQDKLNPHWNLLLASILTEQGDTAAAEVALRRTLYLDPEQVVACVALGHLLLPQPQRRGEALRWLRNALELLQRCAPDAVVADTEGVSAARLRAMIESILVREGPP